MIALAAILALETCGSDSNTKENILRLGILGPFTGPSARTGAEFKGAARLAFERAHYKIGDYKVELVWIDSQSDPQKASVAYEEAIIRNQIDAGCLNWHSSVAVAVMEITARYKIPHFFGMAGTGLVNEKYNSDREKYGYWMAKGWPVPSKLTVSYVSALEEALARGIWKPGKKTAAIWGEDTDWGRAFGQAMKEQLKGRGWVVVAEEYFPLTETDFYPLLRKFKGTGTNLLAGTSTAPPSISAFVKQAREVGLRSLIIADGLGWVGEWYTLTGDASDFVVDQVPDWASENARQFAAAFEKKWGLKPSPTAAGLAYDYTNFFIQIANQALSGYGTLDKETLYRVGKEQLMTGKLAYREGIVMKEYRYTPESAPDPMVGEGKYIFPVNQYIKGQKKIIWPAERRQADLQVAW